MRGPDGLHKDGHAAHESMTTYSFLPPLVGLRLSPGRRELPPPLPAALTRRALRRPALRGADAPYPRPTSSRLGWAGVSSLLPEKTVMMI
uniref:Uncharacterized protein n=1 Tax=Oryza meridionalis TaxID=40149 RepID=A0A0E0CN21_9ORYZ